MARLPSSLSPTNRRPHSPAGSLRVAAPAADENAADARTQTRQRARFSNNFYHRIELILHELIQTVLQQPDDAGATAQAGDSPAQPQDAATAAAVRDAMVRGMVAAISTCAPPTTTSAPSPFQR